MLTLKKILNKVSANKLWILVLFPIPILLVILIIGSTTFLMFVVIAIILSRVFK